MLTSIYPSPGVEEINSTKVCHYYAREWVKLGYNVKVIFNYPIYTRLLYVFSSIFKYYLASKYSSFVAVKRYTRDYRYIVEGVQVNRLPIYKPLPKRRYPARSIKKQIKKILYLNSSESFTPDIIVGHFHHPSLEIVSELADYYNAISCVIIHGESKNIRLYNPKTYNALISNINVWGYRSIAIKNDFENEYGTPTKSFICYSGIPKNFILRDSKRIIQERGRRFLYVGALIARKFPEEILYAISYTLSKEKYSLTIVGVGDQLNKLKSVTKRLEMENIVHFKGSLSRDEVLREMDNSDCFIMISKNETFGLVYLEAMGRGCITIASKNEGMDGIIIDGFNGFLCKAGDSQELGEIIKHIEALTYKERLDLSKRAIETVKNMTDEKVALCILSNQVGQVDVIS